MEHIIDATNKPLGRLASEIAMKLRGKDKPDFLPYVTPINKVIIINSNSVKFTGQKSNQKIYTRHSGYPGGLKSITLEKLKLWREELKPYFYDKDKRKEVLKKLTADYWLEYIMEI